ncbi:MAG: hypothetical protein ACQEXJ_01880 [Myxococcota bacterium]
MSGAALVAGMLVVAATSGAEPEFCERPAHCGEEGVCVGGLCREGSERALVERLHTVAVPPALPVGEAEWLHREAERLTEQIRRDLIWTGFYGVLPEEEMPAAWRAEGVSPAQTGRAVWHAAGARRVLKASLVPTGAPGTYRLRLRLVELQRYEVVDLPEGDVVVRPGETRRASAAWVNALVEHDTGLAGAVGTRLLASVRTGPARKEILALAADGGARWWVTANESLNLNPAWGPDGRVGYMSYRSGNPDWVVDGRPFSARPGLNAAGAWSPDGSLLALSVAEGENSDLLLLDGSDGHEHARLTTDPGVDTSPAWSPDGERIAFVSDRTGSPQIWILSLGGGGLRRVTTGGYKTSPDWSPLGDTLVYTQQVEGGGFAVMRHDLDTDTVARLTAGRGSAEGPTFSPDGRYVVYSRRVGDEEPRLWIMRLDGSHDRPLGAPDRPTFAPDWRR